MKQCVSELKTSKKTPINCLLKNLKVLSLTSVIKYVYSPGDFNEMKKSQSDMNFISKFTNDQGEISDVVGYHKSLAMAMNPDKFAKYFYEQGVVCG